MSRIGFEATFSVLLRGPILVHSSAIGRWGVDAVALRDPSGRLVLSGDAVLGKVREAFDEIGGDSFGRSRRSDMATFVDKADARKHADSLLANIDAPADRYPLFFSDFLSDVAVRNPGDHTISHTAMNVETGSASSGSLRVYDCPVKAGEMIRFGGSVHFFTENAAAGRQTLDNIVRALKWIVAFGSQKSVGFGRNVGPDDQPAVSVERTKITSFNELPRSTISFDSSQSMLVDYTLFDPICFPTGVINGNIYESRDEVPGESFRGALAELLLRIGGVGMPKELSQAPPDHPFCELCRNFDRLRMTTARPIIRSPACPAAVVPRSVAIAGNAVFDFALVDEERSNQLFGGTAAAFEHDWKSRERSAVAQYFNLAFPRNELRVRTAIDEQGSRRAKTHSLFACRVLRPEGIVWRGTIGVDPREYRDTRLSQAQVRSILNQCVTVINSGWLSLGKTRARGSGKFLRANETPALPQPVRFQGHDVFVITLRGAVLMIDPRECVENGCLKHADEIDKLYADYWTEVSDGLLAELPRQRFKQDTLVGGFQARRHRYCPSDEFDVRTVPVAERVATQKQFPYNPTLLIDSGSVFVLRPADGANLVAAREKVSEWLDYGLPLPEWAAKAYGDTYHTNIFLPQNGYGEIDVNLPCHLATFEAPLTRVGGDKS